MLPNDEQERYLLRVADAFGRARIGDETLQALSVTHERGGRTMIPRVPGRPMFMGTGQLQVHVVHAAYAMQYEAMTAAAIQQTLRHGVAATQAPAVPAIPGILLQTVVEYGEKTDEGQIVYPVAFPWLEFARLMREDPGLIQEMDPRRWEEIVAGAWAEIGGQVTLTPRSGDDGRDVIVATFAGGTRIRMVDQVKRYKPGSLVTAEEVRAMIGVLSSEPNVSKAFITTTSAFAPGIATNPKIQQFYPRLELRSGDDLMAWLEQLGNVPPA